MNPVVIFAIVIPMFFSCSSNGGQGNSASDKELLRVQKEIEQAQAEVSKQESEKMNMDRARYLATRHLALKQTRWGKPTAVTEDDAHYYLSYATPKQELRLIGERKLIVEKQTGLVTARKRR